MVSTAGYTENASIEAELRAMGFSDEVSELGEKLDGFMNRGEFGQEYTMYVNVERGASEESVDEGWVSLVVIDDMGVYEKAYTYGIHFIYYTETASGGTSKKFEVVRTRDIMDRNGNSKTYLYDVREETGMNDVLRYIRDDVDEWSHSFDPNVPIEWTGNTSAYDDPTMSPWDDYIAGVRKAKKIDSAKKCFNMMRKMSLNGTSKSKSDAVKSFNDMVKSQRAKKQ